MQMESMPRIIGMLQLRRLISVISVLLFASLGADDIITHWEFFRLNRTFMELMLKETPHSLQYEIPNPHFQRSADMAATNTPIDATQAAAKDSDKK